MSRAGVHRTQISKYERGETEPQAEVLAKLLLALGNDTSDVLAGIELEESEPPRLKIEPVDPEASN